MTRKTRVQRACMALAALCTAWPATGSAQDEDRVRSLREVTVIQRAPLPGLDTPRSLHPGHAQQASDAEIERARAGSLPRFLQRRFAGVSATDADGNPWQPDLLYRGQHLSGTLGSAQGLSLWLDGVRMNQPFGDTLAWDLLPEAAIADVVLVPGSDPLHGRNTLAGALVLTSKSGLTHPGTEAEAVAGPAGLRRADAGHGRQWGDGWHAYVAGTALSDRGWREHSRGRLANLFVRAGRQQGNDGWTVTLLDAASRLSGNGLVPESLARANWRAAYTWPDTTHHRQTLVSLRTERDLGNGRQLAWQAYHRRLSGETRNGDADDDWVEWLGDCAGDPSGAACAAPVPPQAVVRTAAARQHETGLQVQASLQRESHRMLAGIDMASSRSTFTQASQAAAFDASRTTLAGGPAATDAAFAGRSQRIGVFAGAGIDVSPQARLDASARWDRTELRNNLQVPAPAQHEAFRYSRLDPSLGGTWQLPRGITLFANASQSSRVPTPLELGCADPARPCVLPTGLQSDPYLRPAVARTLEAGARTRLSGALQASAAIFRTATADDITFVRSTLSQAGYFTNAGPTLRQGLEIALRARRAGFSWEASYAFVDATYRSPLVLPGPLSTAAQPNAVSAGDPIAGVPRHVLQLAGDWRVQPRWVLGADLVATGSQAVAGNEGGSRPELGRLSAHAVVHARSRWTLGPGVEVDVRIHNLFDRRFATSAAGNVDLFPGGAAVQPGQTPAAARFIAPAAPRMVMVGLRLEWP